MQHATCSMQHATCNTQHATCNTQTALCGSEPEREVEVRKHRLERLGFGLQDLRRRAVRMQQSMHARSATYTNACTMQRSTSNMRRSVSRDECSALCASACGVRPACAPTRLGTAQGLSGPLHFLAVVCAETAGACSQRRPQRTRTRSTKGWHGTFE